jgi:hypothetical protein
MNPSTLLHPLAATAPAKWLCAYRWQVGIRARSTRSLSDMTLDDFRLLEAPYGHFFADPFLVEHQKRTFLFMEDYNYLTRVAKLICSEINTLCEVIETRTIVEQPYHMSYPHVFFLDGSYFMIPETASANRVELYRAVNFPWEWKLETILLDGTKLQDPTHIVINNRHWIFAGGSSTGACGQYDELHLFHAATIYDRFRPHPGNPVKVGLASSRPAGRITAERGRLIRPAQDCSRWYGCGLKFMAIDLIDDSTYAEHEVSSLPDAWLLDGYLGTHTYNASENFETIDVCSYGLELPAIMGRTRTLLQRIAGIHAHQRLPLAAREITPNAIETDLPRRHTA